jgi:ATP-dependent helicase HrpB
MTSLPVEAVLGNLEDVLRRCSAAVLCAPPGSGKTTRVPLALLEASWLNARRILMLEPRRLAARAAASRMADMLGQDVGRTVGYRVRLDSRVGPETRIEVVTEGVLTRILQSDPALSGVGLVIFDEFHERHLESDLGLALCLDIQGVLNETLRLLVMSATLDSGPIADLLGHAPIVSCEGRRFPVETRYLEQSSEIPLESRVTHAVLAATSAEAGSILAFLPGAPEIRRVERRLRQSNLGAEWLIAPLYGNLSREDQDLAIAAPPQGRRKIVLATSIAETSLTIDGIRVIVDGGLMRVPRFDVRGGMTRLQTVPVSRASANQRCGRAGRTGPGICYRLWSRDFHSTLAAYNRPEVLEADLAPLALELAIWGVDDPAKLNWLDAPPAAAFAQAIHLLAQLGAIRSAGSATEHGRRMAALPLHPRLAHMILAARPQGLDGPACDLAALLSERDFIRFQAGQRDADAGLRMDILLDVRAGLPPRNGGLTVDRAVCRRIIRFADVLRQRLGIKHKRGSSRRVGELLAWAYPDRIGRRRTSMAGRFHLTNGRGAFLDPGDPLAAEEYIVAAELDGDRREARIFMGAAYHEQTLVSQYGKQVEWTEAVDWDLQRQAVSARREKRLGALILASEPIQNADPADMLGALLTGIRRQGLTCLPWTRSLRMLQQRALFLRRLFPQEADWPDLSDQGLLQTLEDWLAPHLAGITRLRDLQQIDLKQALLSMLDWNRRQRLDKLAPTHLTVPSGSRVAVDYSEDIPVLAVRIQELFGATKTPAVADGHHPVMLHLLSPAGRPVQITQDLARFWKTGYPEVKKQLKGRYPRHPWPDDPISAQATFRRKPSKNKTS